MPNSYQGKSRGDADDPKRTVSQSVESNMSHNLDTVEKLLNDKSEEVITITPDDTLQNAVCLLRDHRIGALVVRGDGDSLEGILSERDIVRKLADTPGQTLPQKVSENMTSRVETCAPGDSLIEVLRKMSEGRFRHMPVVDGGKVIAMVTIGDVVQYRLRQLEHETLQLKQMVVG